MQTLFENLPLTWEDRLGKSKSAQYGAVRIELQNLPAASRSKLGIAPKDQLLLQCESPLVLFNQNGHPNPSRTTLEAYLQEQGLPLKVVKAAAQTTHLEGWNTQWHSRTGRIHAYQEGSVFLLEWATSPQEEAFEKELENIEELNRTGLGEMKLQGAGWVELKKYDEQEIVGWKKKEKDHPTNGSSKEALLPDLLQSLKAKYDWQEKLNRVRQEALQFAKIQDRTNNHLLGRLEAYLDQLKNRELAKLKKQTSDSADSQKAREGAFQEVQKEFSKWLKENKNAKKLASEQLTKIGLLQDLTNFYDVLNGSDKAHERKAELAYHAWKAVFKQIRNLNKGEKNEHSEEPQNEAHNG